MAPRPNRCGATMDLLTWEAPVIEQRFSDPAITRAATLYGQLCRAMRATLDDCRAAGQDRPAIADRMSEYLGEPYSADRLNADTAESKETHVINAVRLMAFVHATRDPRILSLIAEPLGFALVERRWLPAIDAAILEQHEADIAARRKQAQAQVRRALA